MNTEKRLAYDVKYKIVLPPETPATLARYKEPLTPVYKGHGYIGTLAMNESKTHTQCHICGYFFKGLSFHVMKAHGLKVTDYKDRFGLMRKTSLLADKSPMKSWSSLKNWMDSMTEEQKKARLDQVKSTYEKRMAAKAAMNWTERLESKNIRGRCPEQLLRKILVLSDKLGRTPTRREFIEEYTYSGGIETIYNTFGSWNEAVEQLGLKPNRQVGHSK